MQVLWCGQMQELESEFTCIATLFHVAPLPSPPPPAIMVGLVCQLFLTFAVAAGKGGTLEGGISWEK
jgi:hypothetical protein